MTQARTELEALAASRNSECTEADEREHEAVRVRQEREIAFLKEGVGGPSGMMTAHRNPVSGHHPGRAADALLQERYLAFLAHPHGFMLPLFRFGAFAIRAIPRGGQGFKLRSGLGHNRGKIGYKGLFV